MDTVAASATAVATTSCLSYPCDSDARRRLSINFQNIERPRAARSISAFPIWIAVPRTSLIYFPGDSLLIMPCSEVLGSVNTSATAMPPYGGVSVPSGSAYTLQSQVPSRSQTLSGTISPQSLHNNSRHQWEYKSPSYPTPPSEDSFMSWEPHRRSTDWSP